jgi:hypothetical protein
VAWLNDWLESFPEDEDDEADFDVFRAPEGDEDPTPDEVKRGD